MCRPDYKIFKFLEIKSIVLKLDVALKGHLVKITNNYYELKIEWKISHIGLWFYMTSEWRYYSWRKHEMAAGISLTKDVFVYLGEIKEQLLKDMDDSNVKYSIMFDKLNKDGLKETILHLRDSAAEIIIRNDIVYYIKSDNTEFTHMDTIDEIAVDPLSHVKQIKELVEDRFGKEGYTVKIEKIDTKTMNMTVILASETEKIRVKILRGSLGDVYINTMIRI